MYHVGGNLPKDCDSKTVQNGSSQTIVGHRAEYVHFLYTDYVWIKLSESNMGFGKYCTR